MQTRQRWSKLEIKRKKAISERQRGEQAVGGGVGREIWGNETREKRLLGSQATNRSR